LPAFRAISSHSFALAVVLPRRFARTDGQLTLAVSFSSLLMPIHLRFREVCMSKTPSALSRREFARRAAIASTLGALTPINSLLAEQAPPSATVAQGPPEFTKLSPQSQAEAEARFDAILREYPNRFSDAEKQDLRRLCFVNQQSLDHLRTYSISNGDNPALYLKPLVQREKG
jgi:hypothetical protein